MLHVQYLYWRISGWHMGDQVVGCYMYSTCIGGSLGGIWVTRLSGATCTVPVLADLWVAYG